MNKVNKGTFEGNIEEINFVKNFNLRNFDQFVIKNFNLDPIKVFSVQVSKNKFSKTSNKLVKPKSDAYLIKVNNNINNLLNANDYFLNENDLNSLEYRFIPSSGISIKRHDSKKYQIHKFTVQSFLKVFGNPFIGAGAMIYSTKLDDMKKNLEILKIWNIKEYEILNYFSGHLNKNIKFDLDGLNLIKKSSNDKIKKIILENKNILKLIFTGEGSFDDPFYAKYIYLNGELKKNDPTDFKITTGSNRLKSPTIVVKP